VPSNWTDLYTENARECLKEVLEEGRFQNKCLAHVLETNSDNSKYSSRIYHAHFIINMMQSNSGDLKEARLCCPFKMFYTKVGSGKE
jgi:hypothetical protein